jgi:hypothetical protein
VLNYLVLSSSFSIFLLYFIHFTLAPQFWNLIDLYKAISLCCIGLFLIQSIVS